MVSEREGDEAKVAEKMVSTTASDKSKNYDELVLPSSRKYQGYNQILMKERNKDKNCFARLEGPSLEAPSVPS